MSTTLDLDPPAAPHTARVRGLLANETAMALLERGCTYGELVVALSKKLRAVKSTMADADRAGLVTRVRPVDAVTGAPQEAIVTLRRQSDTSAA